MMSERERQNMREREKGGIQQRKKTIERPQQCG